jgi:4-hydroxy-3-methylbut-2-enyl diphosphate reductase IspH
LAGRAERIRPDGSIEHREIDGSIVVTPNFLRDGPLTIGVTSGASTPDAYLQESIERCVGGGVTKRDTPCHHAVLYDHGDGSVRKGGWPW